MCMRMVFRNINLYKPFSITKMNVKLKIPTSQISLWPLAASRLTMLNSLSVKIFKCCIQLHATFIYHQNQSNKLSYFAYQFRVCFLNLYLYSLLKKWGYKVMGLSLCTYFSFQSVIIYLRKMFLRIDYMHNIA